MNQQASTLTKCKNCGGELELNPKTQLLRCCSCGSEYIADGEFYEQDLMAMLNRNKEQNWSEATVIQCDSCGAQVIVEDTTGEARCAYCGSVHVVKTSEDTGPKPDLVLPFTITREEAVEKFRKTISKKWLVPKEARGISPETIRGVYIPYWTFDAVVDSNYDLRAGTHYSVTVTKTRTKDGVREEYNVEEKRTRWDWRSGVHHKVYDDIIIDGFRIKDVPILQQSMKLGLEGAKPYLPALLKGYEMQRPTVDLETAFEKAKDMMQKQVNEEIKKSIKADTYKDLEIHSNYKNLTYKLMLAPVWMIGYTFRKKAFQSIITGNEGEILGSMPKSKWKVGLVLLIVAAIIAVLVFGCSNYLNSIDSSSSTALFSWLSGLWGFFS